MKFKLREHWLLYYTSYLLNDNFDPVWKKKVHVLYLGPLYLEWMTTVHWTTVKEKAPKGPT